MSSRIHPARVHSADEPDLPVALGAPEAQSGLEILPFQWRQVSPYDHEGAPPPAWMTPRDAPAPHPAGHTAQAHPPAPEGESLPDVVELEAQAARARETARLVAQAAAQGLQNGLAQGRLEGEQRIRAEVTMHVERLARTIADLSGTRDAFRREAEEDVVRLALGVARRILHRELAVNPEALTALLHVALSKFEARELHRVLVSTEDHPAVSTALHSLRLPRRVEVIADPTLERGAALFETVKGTLDASVDTQLDEIERGFLDVLGKEGRRG